MRSYALMPAVAISLLAASATADDSGAPPAAPPEASLAASPMLVEPPADAGSGATTVAPQVVAPQVVAPQVVVPQVVAPQVAPLQRVPFPASPYAAAGAPPGTAGLPPMRGPASGPPVFDERFVLDTGRVPIRPPAERVVSFQIHGELQFRGLGYSDVRLEPRIGAASGEGATLGSNGRLVTWLRLKPIFQYSERLRVVGEIDVPVGMVAGQTTQLVSAALDDSSELAWYGVRPRQLYVEVQTPIGMIRAGQQTSHWGMGLIANDGDHPTLFGDYRRGTIVERLLFATRPMGKGSPLTLAVAGDIVFQDSRAFLVGDIPKNRTPADELGAPTGPSFGRDRAFQAVGAVRWQTRHVEAGLYGIYRNQQRANRSTGALTPFDEYLEVGVVDAAAKFNAPVPGSNSFVFGEAEAAYIGGKTNYLRHVELQQANVTETIQSWGGAAKLGAVHVAGRGTDAFGDLMVALEYGFTSGDADPYDGTTRRFTLDQNHNVGLVLFDHVLAWKTARSATIAQDPRVIYRPAPGLDFLPSEGAVFGASYLNPTVVVRPKRWLDLKGGVVLAQSTADVVDPYQAGAQGRYVNYDRGRPDRRDLGVELDGGVDVRLPVRSGFVVQLGAEGGVLFPGGAFDDDRGASLGTQFLVNSRLGLQF
ncbi:MAG: hypothetical protein FJ096_15580 [Deltaproteobacteria bacterium]|nr:hypothetical protein [Deltaproteobacteria bacterium]